MKAYSGEKRLKTLPLYGDSGAGAGPFAGKGLEIDRRAEFARAYQRSRNDPDFQRLDPVLEYHLGLTPKR